MVENVFNGMFGKVGPGMCRLSMNGGIAVKTANGYKTYDVKKKRLTNCSNFVFNIGEEFFFVIPTNKVEAGDIILVPNAEGRKTPRCVVSVDADTIKAINYEDATVETILPERHVFMGSTYFYGKIVSMFGQNFLKGKKGMDKMMSYMMMSEMMKGMNGGTSNGMSGMLPFMMMGGNMGNIFEGMFDFDLAESEEDDDEPGEDKE